MNTWTGNLPRFKLKGERTNETLASGQAQPRGRYLDGPVFQPWPVHLTLWINVTNELAEARDQLSSSKAEYFDAWVRTSTHHHEAWITPPLKIILPFTFSARGFTSNHKRPCSYSIPNQQRRKVHALIRIQLWIIFPFFISPPTVNRVAKRRAQKPLCLSISLYHFFLSLHRKSEMNKNASHIPVHASKRMT